MAPTLVSKPLKKGWVSVTGWTLPPCARPAVTLVSAPGPCAFYPMLCGWIVGWGCLIRVTATAVGVWVTRGAPPTASFVAMLPGTTWCTGLPAALSSLGQGSHKLSNLLTQLSHSLPCVSCHHSPGPHLFSGFLFLLPTFQAVTISCKYEVPGVLHKYQSHGCVCRPHGEGDPWGALGLQVWHPPWALKLDVF